MAFAGVGSPVVVREQVGGGAGNVSRRADGRRASRVGGADIKAHGAKLRVLAHVDTGQIPPDSGTGEGILVLENIGRLRRERHLDGNTTAVGVGAPVLRVALTTVQGLHFAGDVGDRPQINGLSHVVDDLDAVPGDVGLLASHHLTVLGVCMVAHVVAVVDSREGASHSAEGSEKSESLGKHLETLVCF